MSAAEQCVTQVRLKLSPLNVGEECLHEESCVLVATVYNRVMHVKQLAKEKLLAMGHESADINLVFEGMILSDAKLLFEYGMRDDELYELKYVTNLDMGLSLECRGEAELASVVETAMLGMLQGHAPFLEEHSTGGTYRLFGPDQQPVAMLKPCDEEAFAPQNPRAYVGPCGSPGFVQGTYSATGASREVAAYILDHDHFAHVPGTVTVRARHPNLNNPLDQDVVWKAASLQEYVPSAGLAGDYSPSFFSMAAVHRIAILDIRLVNLDRNDGNILVQGSPSDGTASPSRHNKGILVPIDHGSCLPDAVGATADSIVWMDWPQVRLPFSDTELDYIRNLDVERDVKLLSDVLHIPESCCRLAWAATRLLQIAACHGWTAYDTGRVLYRDDFDSPSKLEMIFQDCSKRSARSSESSLSSSSAQSSGRSPCRFPSSCSSPGEISAIPEFELKVEMSPPPPVPARDPFPTLSPTCLGAEDKSYPVSSTPSTRASSPFGSLPPFELPDLNDSDSTHPPYCMKSPPPLLLQFENDSWEPERTKLFRTLAEAAISALVTAQS
jgi:hypothetical protein